jgi:hypothetical protein
MNKEKELPNGIINPFSDNFLTTWQLWKDFRLEAHQFEYKGCISEQLALIQLSEKALKDEQIAVKIIYQSIENGWSGLYQMKTSKIKNGTEKKSNSKDTRSELNNLYNKRFGKVG